MTKIYTEMLGAGRPIVFVHGWAMHSGVWRKFAGELAKNYQVTLIDLPGHGLSQPVSPFSLETVSEAIADAVAEKTACWLGWSLGAEIIIEIARRCSDKVSGLIILAGTPCFIRNDAWPGVDAQALAKFGENLRQNRRAALLEFLSLQVKGAARQQSILKELEAAIFDHLLPEPEILQAGLSILANTDLRSVFAQLKMPICAILSELDTLVPAEIGSKLEELSPLTELNVISGAGHVPFLSHEEAVIAAIRQFMDKHYAG